MPAWSGGSAWSGGLIPGGCLPGPGGSAWSQGGFLPGPGGSAWSRGFDPGGVSAWSQGGGLPGLGDIPACTEADPPLNRMNDRHL